MSNSKNHELPTLYWIVAIAAVIWNVLGVISYIMEVSKRWGHPLKSGCQPVLR